MSGAVVASSSVICAAGFGAEQVWASTRSKASRIATSHVMDKGFDAIPMGLVPEAALDTDDDQADAAGLPSRARRMLRLATPALEELREELGDDPVILYLGLPEPTAESAPWLEQFSDHLCARAGVPRDEGAGKIFPLGRASVLVALEAALETIGNDPSRPILVGGVDTFLDLRLLNTLDVEGRVLGPEVMDGFVPGEGAAFLLLKSSAKPQSAGILVQGAASTHDPGHRYGKEPARGEGLAQALQLLRSRLSSPPQIATTFAGVNGESFDAKLWGVARLRHRDIFTPDMTLEHPASCFGDTGAATGAILTALAVFAVEAGHRQGPALVWAASDLGERGCALVARAAAG